MRLIAFSNFSEKFVINKHLAPPSIAMLEKTIESACHYCEISARGGILFHDSDSNAVNRFDDVSNYSSAVKELARHLGMTFMRPHKRLGYRGAFLIVAEALRNDPNELYLWMEHDWWFLDMVDVRPIETMLVRPDCNYVMVPNYHTELERFRGHPCPHFTKDVDRRQEEPGPFMRDSLWSSNPHFGKVSKLLEWAEFIRENPMEDLMANGQACGVDWPLCKAYNDDIDTLGFDAAHAKWGMWLMLNNGGFGRMVEHVGI